MYITTNTFPSGKTEFSAYYYGKDLNLYRIGLTTYPPSSSYLYCSFIDIIKEQFIANVHEDARFIETKEEYDRVSTKS